MSLFAGYAPDGFYDEMFEAHERPRVAYRRLYQGLSTLRPSVFAAKAELADRCYLNQGITFAVKGREETFPFDLLPRLIPAREWARLEAGLVQRVRALDRFLADVYGPRRAVRDGVIPNALLATCQGYQREMIGVEPPGGRWVHVAGVDLVRDADGRWLVLEDNVRTPSGLSYVVQNRAFMRRVFPEAFGQHHVEPVDHAPFLLLDALVSCAPAGRGVPRVVLLTPGPFNAAYYEHAFLAQQMGVPLVEGRDLVVRDRRVWLRTTSGREPVDVIYRRVDDAFLDPVSLRPDSLLGVPGLMQVIREGRVSVANVLGTGVADDKAVYAWVPDLIRYYLGEEPLLGQVATYLMERDEDRAFALAHLDRLVVKAVDGAGGYGMLMGAQATPAERAAFARRVEQNPRGYIAQETIRLSRAPTFVDGHFCARHVDLRPFVVFGDRPTVVPGRADPGGAAGGLAGRELLPGRRQQGHLGAVCMMLARVAESLYWTARDLERAETLSRLLEVSHAMALERGLGNGGGGRSVWEPLVEITGDTARFMETHLRADERSVAWFLTFSPANPNSILACVTRARSNARGVRNTLPSDVWESLNEAYLELAEWGPRRISRDGVYPFCQAVRRASHLIQGLVDQGMRHDESWQFMRLGRYLERAEKGARLLEIKFHLLAPEDPAIGAAIDLHQWRALLRSVSAEEVYVHADPAGLSPQAVARFLILDERFPRSVAYALAEVEDALGALVADGALLPDPPALTLARAARASLSEAAVTPVDRALADLLDRIQARCNAIGDRVAEACFDYPHDSSDGERHPQAVRQAQN